MRTYDDYVESRQEMPDIAKAEDALSALLKRIDNSELRDAIDRAAGHVAYLREKSAFEAGQKAECLYQKAGSEFSPFPAFNTSAA